MTKNSQGYKIVMQIVICQERENIYIEMLLIKKFNKLKLIAEKNVGVD